MSSDLIQIRVPHEMKLQADAVLAGVGLKTPEAVRVFLQQCINSNGLPFQPAGKVPNAETLAAFEEIKEGKATPVTMDMLRQRMTEGAASDTNDF